MENKEKIIPCRSKRLELRETKEFRYTNRLWNDRQLNHAWTIGLMMKIIGDKTFRTYGEWERHYLGTGEKRQNILKAIPQDDATRLRNLHLNYTHYHNYKRDMSQDTININESYGRTMDEIEEIGKILFKAVVHDGNPLEITENDCINYAFVRIVDEAYIGMEREFKTIDKLQRNIPGLTTVKTDPDTDRFFAVDAEVFDKENKLICGIQIKSSSYYRDQSSGMKKTKVLNYDKNDKYTEKTGVPVFYVYSKTDGFILNMSILNEIVALAK